MMIGTNKQTNFLHRRIYNNFVYFNKILSQERGTFPFYQQTVKTANFIMWSVPLTCASIAHFWFSQIYYSRHTVQDIRIKYICYNGTLTEKSA